MSETTDGAGGSESIFRLIYRSHSLIAADQRKSELGEIFASARRNNRELDVTGALMISDDAFVQALEGDEGVVRDLYARIGEDARHQDVSLLEEQQVDDRAFARWAMAQVGTDGGCDIRLMSNPSKGVIVQARAEDPSITPAQEAVLASMRRSLAMDTLET